MNFERAECGILWPKLPVPTYYCTPLSCDSELAYSKRKCQQGLLCITALHMATIDQRDLDICAKQKSEEWEVLSVRSKPQRRTLANDHSCDSNPAVYLP